MTEDPHSGFRFCFGFSLEGREIMHVLCARGNDLGERGQLIEKEREEGI